MAKSRTINTKFWDDSYIVTLNPTEKLLFLYFLTNSSTEICGAYEISIRKMVIETGLTQPLVESGLKRFQKDSRILYREGWLFIPNFIKNQSINPSVRQGIIRTLENTPKWIQEMADWHRLGTASPQDALTKLNLTKLNLTKLRAKPRKKSSVVSESKILMDAFYKINPGINFKNTNEWAAADWILTQVKLEEALEMVEYVAKHNGEEFAPLITTPYEMKIKWAKLNSLAERRSK